MTLFDNISFEFMPILNRPFQKKLSLEEKTFNRFALSLQPSANVAMAAIASNLQGCNCFMKINFNTWPLWVADNNIRKQQKFYSLPK
jgi:hypothetical protein